jgi:hypothetical protein
MALTAMACAAVLGAGSCGGDDGGAAEVGVLPSTDRVIADQGGQATGKATGTRAEVQEVVDDVQDALLTATGWGVCNELADPEAEATGGARCSEAYDRILRSPEMMKTRRVRSRVVSVDVRAEDGEAIATVESPGRSAFEVRLVGAPGAWKLPRVDLDDPSGLPAD